MSDGTLDKPSLVSSVTSLFKQNHYQVTGPLQIHGAEVDLKADSMSDIFSQPIYIEATEEYVDVDKYGKDMTKLSLIREKEPDAQLFIISSKGFTVSVRERAKATRVQTFTYSELFGKFQRFGPYLKMLLDDGQTAHELEQLDKIYEEPNFEDAIGREIATQYLNGWKNETTKKNSWIIILGEYGTGKSTLTRILTRRWAQDYVKNPSLPIPFRIELQNFVRQFDARTLLHHFLDTNHLGHIPIAFIEELIRAGRIVLLLDGYDEMAQHMHVRERRACLDALAQLSAGGAVGLLTSRPNYFTEAEELNVLETLYATLTNRNMLTELDRRALADEKALDDLLQRQFLEKHERKLRDLDKRQTESLVRRALVDDIPGQEAVLSILAKLYRTTDEGTEISLSGKPVIIAHLLEVVEELKRPVVSPESGKRKMDRLQEWQIYRLIIDNLLLKDLKRAPEMLPLQRHRFLKSLGFRLSLKGNRTIDEEQFLMLVRKEFHQEIMRHPTEHRETEVQRLFAILRSSGTLTRATENQKAVWRFSHNSLREFLVTEFLLDKLHDGEPRTPTIPITDAMRMFVASLPLGEIARHIRQLELLLKSRAAGEGAGIFVNLLWDAGLKVVPETGDRTRQLLEQFAGNPPALQNIEIDRMRLTNRLVSTDLSRCNFAKSHFTDVDFQGASLESANFTDAKLESVQFVDTNLRAAKFNNATLYNVDLSGADIDGADFCGLDELLMIRFEGIALEGKSAVGFLAFHGGITDPIEDIHVFRHHPLFDMADKIATRLITESQRQLRGLTQRGPAQANPPAAREFVRQLENLGYVETLDNRSDCVRITDRGRPVLKGLSEKNHLAPEIAKYFRGYP